MKTRLRCVFILGLTSSLAACARGGGGKAVITSEVECPSCTIRLDSVTVLHGIAFNGPVTAIARSPGGAYYLRDSRDGLLKRFGPDGRLVASIGHTGGGPGEYERLRNIVVGPGDTIQIVDHALGRRSRFVSTGRFLGSERITVTDAGPMPAVLLPDGRLVINTAFSDSTGARALVAIVNRDGGLTPLSMSGLVVDDRQPGRTQRLIQLRPLGGLVVADPWTFQIELFGPGLRSEGLVVRTADWIPMGQTSGELSDGVFERPSSPQLRAAWEDSQGRLWLQMSVPSSAWKPGPSQATAGALSPDEYMKLADRPRTSTVVEVIDVARRRVLARARFEGGIGLPIDGGYLARPLSDSAGEEALKITQLTLSQ